MVRSSDHWKNKMFENKSSYFLEILRSKKEDDIGAFVRNAAQSRGKIRVLDMGCGIGRHFKSLSKVASTIVGVDYSAPLLNEAVVEANKFPGVVALLGDMRHLDKIFVGASFEVILRLYTSLGYFDRKTETKILKTAIGMSADCGLVILDTFNADWIKKVKEFRRTTKLKTFSLFEKYTWMEAVRKIRCLWTYQVDGRKNINIEFNLDGYNRYDVESLLRESGWRPKKILPSYDLREKFKPDSERIIAIAERA